MKTKKIALSLFVIIAFGGYALYQTSASTAPVAVSENPVSQPRASSSPVSSEPPPETAGAYKDGTYTGPVTDAFYGTVQVEATVSGGKLTNVQFLRYPNDRGTSVEINRQATPLLAQEAISAQSANVNVISGATQTSEAFRQSLGGALQQAAS